MPVAHLPVFEYVRYVLPQSKLNRPSRPLLSWCFRPLLVKRCYCNSLLRELSHGGKWIFLVLFALQSSQENHYKNPGDAKIISLWNNEGGASALSPKRKRYRVFLFFYSALP